MAVTLLMLNILQGRMLSLQLRMMQRKMDCENSHTAKVDSTYEAKDANHTEEKVVVDYICAVAKKGSKIKAKDDDHTEEKVDVKNIHA
eukprot:11809164-Ditylum_brightwellii.AAC.1